MNKIKELKAAIELRNLYNSMKYEDFIKEYEEYLGEKVPLRIIKEYYFTGLNNTTFMDAYETSNKISIFEGK